MELILMDTKFTKTNIIDIFSSLIWTIRYNSYGDFQLTVRADNDALNMYKDDYYLINDKSDRAMIIETKNLKTDSENGDVLTVTGRSLESILERRVLWNQTILTGSLQNGIKKLITENIISPSIEKRKITNFIFKESTDISITNLEIEAQLNAGENLYDAIVAICESAGIGFKIYFDDSYNFVFELYNGVDRSFDQEVNSYVVFSPNYDNLINSEMVKSKKTLKNVSLVIGEGEGSSTKIAVAENDTNAIGLDRREMSTDASDLSTIGYDSTTISDEDYTKQLVQKGKEDLANNIYSNAFEGGVDDSQTFIFNKDYFIGDIVQLQNEYNFETKARISEIIFSESTDDISIHPTFIGL